MSASLQAAPRIVRGLLLATLVSLLFTTDVAGDTVNNRSSDYIISVDGSFTDLREWSDVLPLGFISPTDADSPVRQVSPDSDEANSLLYITTSPGEPPWTSLYVIAALLPRTQSSYANGQTVAEIRFPAIFDGVPFDDFTIRIVNLIVGRGFHVMNYQIDLTNDGSSEFTPAALDIDVVARFGSSPLSPESHLVIEMRIPLSVAAGYGDLNGNASFDPPNEVFLPEGHFGYVPTAPSGLDPMVFNFTRDPPSDPKGVERDEGPEAEVHIQREGTARSDNDSLPVALPSGGFTRGNGNGDAQVDLSDAVYVLAWLFTGGPAPPCREAANINGAGGIDVADPIYLLTFLFQGGAPPPAPHPFCATTPALHGCASATQNCVP